MANAIEIFTNKLKDWQREGYYVLLNNFHNMMARSEKYSGFVLSVVPEEEKFVFKLYDKNKTLNERHYKYDQVEELINEIDVVVRS